MKADLEGEVGDLLFTLVAFANATSIDLDDSIIKTMEEYKIRDAQDWQKTQA